MHVCVGVLERSRITSRLKKKISKLAYRTGIFRGALSRHESLYKDSKHLNKKKTGLATRLRA